jgi:hypothetical protein
MTTVTSVVASGTGITSGNGKLNAGRVIALTLNTSDPVTVAGGVPTLSVNDLGIAVYDAVHSTATALVFNYTVAAPENTADLAVTAINLNGATIKNGSNIDADLTGAVANPAGTLQIDTIGPQVTAFTGSDPLATNADVVHYTLTFSEPVTGVDAGDFSLATTNVIGASIASVTPVPGSNGAQYVVAVNTGSGNGTIGISLSTGAATAIKDLAGNAVQGAAFAAPISFETPQGPLSVAIGDVNDDGKADLVITRLQQSSFPNQSVALGNGDGTFQPLTHFGTGIVLNPILLSDLNGDAKLDFIGAGIGAGSGVAAVRLGNGNGTFQAETDYAAGGGEPSIAAADLNGDGKPDLVVGNSSANIVSVLLNNGSGAFPSRVDFSTGSGPTDVAIADVNRDGKPDILAASSLSNKLSVLLGNGDGTLQPRAEFDTGVNPRSLAVGDLNGDGKLDVATANQQSSTISVLLGQGDGTFQLTLNKPIGVQPTSIEIDDFNGDGRLDLITMASGAMRIFPGNGDGTFSAPPLQIPVPDNARSFTVGDVDGNARPDLVAVSFLFAAGRFFNGANLVSAFLNNGPTPTGPTYKVGPPGGFDFNADGMSDILWQNADGTPAVWLLNGVNISSTGPALPNPGPSWHENAAADFNGDGKADILFQNDNGTPAVWLMNGTSVASFGPQLANPGPSWHEKAAADFNGDGKADILWQNDNGAAAVWLMDGTGVASFGPALPNPGPAWHANEAADFNADGKADILWQNDDGTPAVWLMDGTNLVSFGAPIVNPGAAWHEKAAADFNGDGKADILWQNDNGAAAVWLMDGTTILSMGPALPNPGTAWHAKEAVDTNGDGKADILWQNDNGAPAVWLMDGVNIMSTGGPLSNPGSAWHIV